MSNVIQATTDLPGASAADGAARSLVRVRRRIGSDAVMAGLSQVGALSIVAMLLALLSVLAYAAWPSIETFGWKFLVTSQWRPNELNVPSRDAAGNVIMEDGEVVVKTIPPVFGALPDNDAR